MRDKENDLKERREQDVLTAQCSPTRDWMLELDLVRVLWNRESGYLAIFDVNAGSFVVC